MVRQNSLSKRVMSGFLALVLLLSACVTAIQSSTVESHAYVDSSKYHILFRTKPDPATQHTSTSVEWNKSHIYDDTYSLEWRAPNAKAYLLEDNDVLYVTPGTYKLAGYEEDGIKLDDTYYGGAYYKPKNTPWSFANRWEYTTLVGSGRITYSPFSYTYIGRTYNEYVMSLSNMQLGDVVKIRTFSGDFCKAVYYVFCGRKNSIESDILKDGSVVSGNTIEVPLGSSLSLTGVVKGDMAGKAGVKSTWSTGNSSIATVSNGTITPKKAGTTTIYYNSVYKPNDVYTNLASTSKSVTIKVVKKISSISVNPTKTVYNIGDAFGGGKINITYEDGSTANVAISKYMSGFNTDTAGTRTATVTYGGITKTFSYTVKPDVPTPEVESKGYDFITLKQVEDAEYTADGINWQESPTITGLVPGTTYTVKLRIPDSTDSTKKAESDSISVTTDSYVCPAVSIMDKTGSSITVHSVDGAEYSNDGGNTWQSSNVFEGLKQWTEYQIVQRIPNPYVTGTTVSSDALTVETNGDPYLYSDYDNSPIPVSTEKTIVVSTKGYADSVSFDTITSSNEEVASISEITSSAIVGGSGTSSVKITGNADGFATITVTMSDGTSLSFDVYVGTTTKPVCSAPSVSDVGTTTIEVDGESGAEYSIDNGETWVSTNSFTGLIDRKSVV